MSERYSSIIDEIKKNVFERPKDLKNEELIFGSRVVPVLFTDTTFAEDEAYASKMLHVGHVSKFFTKPNFKFGEENDIIWNLEKNKQGTFDEEGRFVLEECFDEPSNTLWFFQVRKDHMHGPFTSAEMREKAKNNELENAMIKRNNDAVCISFKRLKELSLNLFDNEKGIEAVFLEEIRVKEMKMQKLREHAGVDKQEIPEKKVSEMSITDVLQKCNKSKDFLIRKKSKANIEDVGKKLEGQDKSTCIKTISKITGMGRIDSETFLDIFIEESKLPICSNVDKEGFEIFVINNQKNNTHRIL